MLEKLKGNKYKFNDLILYEEVVIKHNLMFKKKIDNIDEIKKDNYYYEIYNMSLKYLNKKIRSYEELKTYLLKKEYDFNIVNEVLEKLKSLNILNDELYCKCYINDKLNLSKEGINKIKKDLVDKKLDLNIIENCITKDLIETSNNKLYSLMKKYIEKNNKNKTYNYFLNLGYDLDLIKETYNSFNVKFNINIIQKEYDKLYGKYKLKYKDYELDNYIKQRLYQKGYSMDEINSIKKNQ